MNQLDLPVALQNYFGFPSFRVGQQEAIEHALARRDALVVMPTGSGKSLCYQLPALLLDGTTLVISPLIALMKDQVDALTVSNKRATFINSTLSSSEQNERLARLARGEYKIVYVAPERLRNADLLRALASAQTRVALLAVDEAHCISQWGHDFRPDYMHVREFIPKIGKPPVFALTATATPEVQDDILKQLGLANAQRIVTGFNRPNLSFAVRYTPSEAEKLRELQVHLKGSCIVYTGTRREAEGVAEFINEVAHIRAAHYHAGLDDDERTRTQDDFMHGVIPVIVATNAFGMGVDKPDIRAVIHFNLPSTVEAYYQEVGRAGRDGKPARGILLYSPEDRALQEWFIENDAPRPEQTLAVYRTLPRGIARVSSLDLQRETGLNDTRLKLALRELEIVGAVQRLGDERGAMLLRVENLARLDLAQGAAEIERFRESKRRKLAQMVRYAETNGCRRRFILDYFGDSGVAEAIDCCDNHIALTVQTSKVSETSEVCEVALTILDCVRVMNGRIGRLGIGKILAGSHSHDIARWQRSPFFGKLAQYKLRDLDEMVNALIRQGYIKIIGGEYPVIALSPRGAEAIKTRAAIALAVPQTARPVRVAQAERKLGTVEYTHQLLGRGLSLAEIAQERGLSIKTIYGHLAQLIEQGLVHVDAVIPREIQTQVRDAMAKTDAPHLFAIKVQLPETISYEEIRCVVAAHDLERNGPKPMKLTAEEELAPLSSEDRTAFDALRELRTELARAENVPAYVVFSDRTLRALSRQRPQTMDEFDAVFGIGQTKAKQYGARVLALLQKHARSEESEDAVTKFLSSSRPKPLRGPWSVGFALDFNSKFAGARWARTELGEWVYRFKYGGEPIVVEQLAARLADFLCVHSEMRADLIIPIPSTKKERPYDPVPLLARALGKQIGVAVNETALVKTRAIELQKAMTNLAQKQANIRGAFCVTDANPLRAKRVLLLDDFFDSGATLAEATRVALAAGAAEVCVLAVTKTIHGDL